MLGFVLRRLLTLPLLVLAMYGGAVLLLMAAPGDPFGGGEKELSPEVRAEKLRAFNYDQHWLVRYFWTWPKRLVWDGDLPAHQYEDWTVAEILRSTLPVSLQLGVLALTLAILLGTLGGIAAARLRGRPIGVAASLLTLVGICVPSFAIGVALLVVLGLWLQIAPVIGWSGPRAALLPALTLALPHAAYIARLLRSALIETYAEDYIRTARAKGLSATRVLFDHALRAALRPVLSYLGPAAAGILTGAFVVEKVFSIPGLGTHIVQSINNRDHSMVLAVVLVYGVVLALLNLVVDVLYAVVDPRIRLAAAPPPRPLVAANPR